MNVLAFRHFEFDDPAAIEEWALNGGHKLDRGIKVLGICLGAQMLADVLGGVVTRHREKEIGWHRMHRTEERHPWLADLPESFTSFSWHGDTYTLPAGARRLAYSEACVEQAFAYGDHVLGLQFHLETTPACMGQMLEKWSFELQDKPYIQGASDIRAGMANSRPAVEWLHRILSHAVTPSVCASDAL
jgi:GMP synthase-like glutamine amidotransferase